MTISYIDTLNKLKQYGFVPKSALDIGCNAGNWTKELQNIYPDIQVTMIDGNDQTGAPGAKFVKAVLSDKPGPIDWLFFKSLLHIMTIMCH